jgi:hypothetical protein
MWAFEHVRSLGKGLLSCQQRILVPRGPTQPLLHQSVRLSSSVLRYGRSPNSLCRTQVGFANRVGFELAAQAEPSGRDPRKRPRRKQNKRPKLDTPFCWRGPQKGRGEDWPTDRPRFKLLLWLKVAARHRVVTAFLKVGFESFRNEFPLPCSTASKIEGPVDELLRRRGKKGRITKRTKRTY